MAKAAEHLSEMPEMTRFRISHPKLSKRTTPGSKVPIESEVAAAVEGMQTWHGYERQTEIVTAGLLALHGDPSVDVGQVAADLREQLPASELAPKLVEALEQKAGQRAPRRLGRAFWTRIAIAGSGALVGCLALLLAPLLPGRADAAGDAVVMVPAIVDHAPAWVRFEPGSLLAVGDPLRGPAEQKVPMSTLPGQKVAPCDEGMREEAIFGNCWARMDGAPPCGRLFRHGDKCYRPVAADPRKLIGPVP